MRLVRLAVHALGASLLATLLTPSVAAAPAAAEPLRVAAASSLERAVKELSAAFTKSHGTAVAGVYAASGKLVAQVKEGAPVDVMMAADIEYPESLAKAGLAAGSYVIFAKGPLALWTMRTPGDELLAGGLSALTRPAVKKIAVANARVAPYGRAAEAALTKAGVFSSLKAKLVFGENVAQVNHYVSSGAVDVGLTARASVTDGVGTMIVLPADVAPPLPQGVVVTKRGGARADGAANAFVSFVLGAEGQKILATYGYLPP
jgi:molybdate transport system substrate-binding protein